MADMNNQIGPCDWPALDCEDMYGLETEEAAQEVEEEAKYILWSFTGQRYGICEVVLTPPPVCHCRILCGCRGCVLDLPAPANEVLEVLVNGEPYNDWVLRGNQLLSSKPWPRDVQVTFQRGIVVPAGGARVVSELARELALYRCNDKKCRLPSNIVSRTRQGDTINFSQLPTRQRQEIPLLGIPMIDLWIRAVNGVKSPARVWTPDVDPFVADWVSHGSS